MNYQERENRRISEWWRENRISEWWRLAEEFTVHEAALLIVGVDPHCETGSKCKDLKPHERPDGYGAVVRAITGALGPKVSGRHIPHYDTDINGNICGELEGTTDIHSSTVVRDSLVIWLENKGVKGGFFFPDMDTTDTPGYLDPKHERFSAKLAAAVLVWQAMGDENLIGPKGLMNSMEEWLGSRYKELGLEWQGTINKSGIAEAAKVANWKTTGGATKTPGG